MAITPGATTGATTRPKGSNKVGTTERPTLNRISHKQICDGAGGCESKQERVQAWQRLRVAVGETSKKKKTHSTSAIPRHSFCGVLWVVTQEARYGGVLEPIRNVLPHVSASAAAK